MAPSGMDDLANGGGVMRLSPTVIFALFGVWGCAPPTPIQPVVDSGDGDPCAVIQAVDRARLIRLSDGGTFDEPCSPVSVRTPVRTPARPPALEGGL